MAQAKKSAGGAILLTATGVRDIADGGLGFSFPVWAWDGTRYAPAGPEVSYA